MFISKKEKQAIWKALQEMTEILNIIRLDLEKAKYGYRISDGEPRIKQGRPVGSKNKPKQIQPNLKEKS
jgi:hypothetical protein